MDRTRAAALTTVLLAVCLVVLALGLASGSRPGRVSAAPLQADPLTVSGVVPDTAPNDLDVSITIAGSGFAAVSGTQVITPPMVFVGETRLPDVTWVSSTQLLSLVPWGLVPGVYPLTVTNPDGLSATLTDALTITQSIGVWSTDGPYGGSVSDIAVSPADPSRVLARVSLAGLFGSHDAGGLWERTGLSWGREVDGITYGSALPGTLYALGGQGLWSSPDDGQSWHPIVDGRGVMAFAQHPTDADTLYISRWDLGVFRSADGGLTWENRSAGIDLLRVRGLTIDPLHPTTLYATTDRYGVYKSTDEGLLWTASDSGLADDPDDNAYELAVDPFDSDKVWAVGVYQGHFFSSNDGAESWITVPITYPVQRSLAFSQVVPGVLYAGATHDLVATVDGGSTWHRLNETPLRMIEEIALDPSSGLPVYLGTNGGGAYHSTDGGIHWQQVVEGMTGIEPRSVVPAPSEPERLYFAAVDGVFRSNNGGGSWIKDWAGETWIASVDPNDSLTAYVSPSPGWGACTVAKTTDGGLTWAPETVCEEPGRYVTSLAFYPGNSLAMLAGGGDNWGHFADSHGWLARSDDGGTSWQEVTIGAVISDVTALVIDLAQPQTLFLGSCTIHPYWNLGSQSGIYKSTDGGGSWEQATSGLTHRCVRDLVMHPENHDLLLAAVNDPAPGAVGIYRTTDAGAIWTPSASGMETSQVLELAFDPLVPSTVYAATWHGLYRSTDSGQSWSRAEGALGYVPVFSVAAVAGAGRTLVYIGTVGGGIEGRGAAASGWRLADSVEAGVYRLAVVPGSLSKIFLPLIVRVR